jgi:hypothetical protein
MSNDTPVTSSTKVMEETHQIHDEDATVPNSGHLELSNPKWGKKTQLSNNGDLQRQLYKPPRTARIMTHNHIQLINDIFPQTSHPICIRPFFLKMKVLQTSTPAVSLHELRTNVDKGTLQVWVYAGKFTISRAALQEHGQQLSK